MCRAKRTRKEGTFGKRTSRAAKRSRLAHDEPDSRIGRAVSPAYLPLVSTFCFSSSFIFLTVASWLVAPVVWFVAAGAASLGAEVCAGDVFAGRVAVVSGGGLA